MIFVLANKSIKHAKMEMDRHDKAISSPGSSPDEEKSPRFFKRYRLVNDCLGAKISLFEISLNGS